MMARKRFRSTLRSPRCKKQRDASSRSERGVPPSPNMREVYQTSVLLSILYLPKSLPGDHASGLHTPPPLPPHSPFTRAPPPSSQYLHPRRITLAISLFASRSAIASRLSYSRLP